ncbi:MAG: histidine phosphatase family protein [Alphaproteobacteria bacterium]
MNQDVIIIVRHGKPSLSKKVRLTWSEFLDWWKRYDESGLAPKQKIPKKIIAYAKEADVIVSSSLPRAVESAELAAGRAPDFIEDGLIEAALPAPPTGPLKMGPKSWGTFSRILWYVGWSGGMESHREARVRAEHMCDVLAEHASGGKMVFVTAHGWFNRMVKGSLQKRGWKCVKQNGDLHWSHRRFERPTKNLGDI